MLSERNVRIINVSMKLHTTNIWLTANPNVRMGESVTHSVDGILREEKIIY